MLLLFKDGGGFDSTTFKVICNLVSRKGERLPNLSLLSWAWFDEEDPVNFAAPTDQGELESTNFNGAFSIDLPNTTLIWGQSGTLILRSDSGVNFGAYNLEVQ